jgi:glucose-6-phosphate dehydrogenase assembly protein OpcA
MSGELTKHAESVVLPLLLPDSPVVSWWPAKAPDNVGEDALGSLAQRRITDSAFAPHGKSTALLTQALHYSAGNTDLAWTRLTHWRALLAAALDQYTGKVRSAEVVSERISPSADLLAAWLRSRLKIQVTRASSKGPGITLVRMATADGDIAISRPDGRLAQFTIPGQPDRPVALKRRETAELLAEELRRLDPDDVYAQTVKVFAAASRDG